MQSLDRIRRADRFSLAYRKAPESEELVSRLTEAVVESVAAENAARFAAMDSAHDNVAKKLAQFHRSAHLARQDEKTTELLDLITGAEAQASE